MPNQSLHSMAIKAVHMTFKGAKAQFATVCLSNGVRAYLDLQDPILMAYLATRHRFHTVTNTGHFKKRNIERQCAQ